jgi:GT2 family glycosyltransferase
VGLVGPVTNCASGPQQIPVDHQDLIGLPAFATRQRQEKAGRAVRVDRLTGFCLLVRREVFEQVGNFDEQFGLGFFDDDDLCVRAREAGFQLLVAEDVFVHHFGNRTFRGLGIDCKKLLMSNFERFKNKWGSERAAGYHLVGAEESD